uniref:APC membrane recruitment protein 2 n=1 Tax=Lates calcarifer TaxID=8187 RepID=A0A4W6CWH0_LATCA
DKKTRQRGGAFKGEIEEKGLDGKDRQREGYRQPIKKQKMDVQTENVDPPPCESQPSGKIRKGFKLFGKRKPGNIFSIRNKGDGNNKSPVIRSKTLDGLSETTVSQGEREQAEEDGEDGVLAAAPARTSISSASSAKSLSFLSLLRGGRRGVGDRRVHTVSQPVGRQRRGLKGLFGNVKFRSKDKEDKEEAPPSPLLMSSRANSVEIIKEDLTLTPKSQPRSLDSPETESCEPVKSLTSQGSAATSPSETLTPQATAGNVSRTNEHVPPLRIPQVKASGLSKIPVVGGGRAGKLPVRDSQHVDDEASRDPPTPVLEEEKPHFNSHDAGSKDKISDIEANVPTFKHTQEESQQPPQPKVLTSLPRDSKIPVKHGAQSHTASQIPQAKEPPRTKIPVSKVPVRRVGNKPAAAGGSTQIRK